MLKKDHYYIIDWMTACKGEKLSDVARTGIILRFSEIPRIPNLINIILKAIKKKVYEKYLKEYLKITGVCAETINMWDMPVAAARLREWIPEKERQNLLVFVRHMLAVQV